MLFLLVVAGRGSSVGSEAARDARNTEIDPTSGTFFREYLVMAILSPTLIQEYQLSSNGKGMYTKYW